MGTGTPPVETGQNPTVKGIRGLGKRIAIGIDNDLWLVFHLMIAGRLHWKERSVTADGRRVVAAFYFHTGTLTLSEAGSKKRASLHVVAGEAELAQLDPGGIDVLAAGREQFPPILTFPNPPFKHPPSHPPSF